MKNGIQKSEAGSQSKEVRRGLLSVICLLTSVLFFVLFSSGALLAADRPDIKDDIKQAVLKELVKAVPGEVEITGFRVLKGAEFLNCKGLCRIDKAEMNGYNGQNRINFMVNISDDKANTHNMIAEVSFDVLTDVFVAARLLSRGAVLSESDFYSVKQKSSRLPAGVVSDKKDFAGMTLKSSIAQGVVLRTDHLTSQKTARKGQKVDVNVVGSNVSISTRGVLRGDAVIGGTVKVFCDATKKELSGILIDSNTVQVQI